MANTSGLNPDKVMLGTANGAGLWVAPVGTEPPATVGAPWGVGWTSLGYVSDDGVKIAVETESETLTPWQSRSPIRTVVTGKSLTMEFTLWEFTAENVALYFDTEKPAAATGDAWTVEVRSDGGGATYAVGIATRDGDRGVNYVFGRASLSESGEIELTKATAQGLPVTLAALDDGGVLCTITSGSAAAPPPPGA
jgi:hypothetical protein